MAFITVSGEPGCRTEELARAVAQLLRFELISESKIALLLAEEFGSSIPDRAWVAAATSLLARLGSARDLVIAAPGAEHLLSGAGSVLRIYLIAREAHRAGNFMLESRTDRAHALELLHESETAAKAQRRARFGRSSTALHRFDLILNSQESQLEALAAIVVTAAELRNLRDAGPLPAGVEAQLQFQARLKLAKFGITPAGKASIERKQFSHPSEGLFANLLDFYRIAWEYEPRSFPLQWDKDGKITEAFTPDFYLSEFDLYVELTTMKQALVTKKNRKVKLLKVIYPHVNIRVFYQKDFQDLIFKHGLEGREAINDATE